MIDTVSRRGLIGGGDALAALVAAGCGKPAGQAAAPLELAEISDFGGWAKAQATHFADGGVFDRIYGPRPASAPIAGGAGKL